MLSIDHSFHFFSFLDIFKEKKCIIINHQLPKLFNIKNAYLCVGELYCSEIYQVLKWTNITIIKKGIMLSHKL